MVQAPNHPNADSVLDSASKAGQAIAQLDKGNVSKSLETNYSVLPSQLHPSGK